MIPAIWGGALLEFFNDHGWIRVFWDNNRIGEDFERERNIIGVVMHFSTPFLSPLWFIRDLIVIVIFSPLMYFVVKKIGLIGLAVAAVCMCLNIWIPLEGFSPVAFFFFLWGSYMRITKRSVLTTFKKVEIISYIFIIITLVLRIYYYSTNYVLSNIAVMCYSIFGVIVAFNIASRFYTGAEGPMFKLLSASTFFIYVTHSHVKGIVSSGLIKIIHSQSELSISLTYLLRAFSTVFLCVFLYALLRRICPKTLALMTGGR